MKMEWYYADNTSADDSLVDEFADSKFEINRWNSFAREIIQNSIDAVDDESKPVEVVFDLNKTLSLRDIPGGMKIKDVLERCFESATNKQTKSAYKKGLEIFEKDKVYCLKISDYNTKGVKTGRDDAWGALVFDEGKSVKQRPGGGSAGSHGVGKKVPFIISTCNTVYYATKNKYEIKDIEKSDQLFQGKTVLITWKDDDNKRKYHKGWLGLIDENEEDSRNKSKPIMNEDINTVSDYFIRKDRYGTDVTIIGVNAYDIEEEIKKGIINAILDNFFVSIKENRLAISVFGEVINNSTFESIFKKYYEYNSDEAKNILNDLLNVYDDEHKKTLKIETDEGVIGEVDIYFGLGNEFNRKYYAIVRSHGMKIKEQLVRTDQAFSCFVIVKGDKVNDYLSSLENAAHDDFITKDENMDIDEKAIAAYNSLTYVVKKFLKEECKIEDAEEQDIEGLNDILSIPGQLASVHNKKHQIKKKRNKIKRDEGGERREDGEGHGGTSGQEKPRKKRGKGRGGLGGEGEIPGTLIDEYVVEPVFVKTNEGTILKFEVDKNIQKADIVVKAINSENKLDKTMGGMIASAKDERKRLKINNGKIENIKLRKNHLYSIQVNIKGDLITKLNAEIYAKE